MSRVPRSDRNELDPRNEHGLAAFAVVAFLVLGSLLLLGRFAAGKETSPREELELAAAAIEAAQATAVPEVVAAPETVIETPAPVIEEAQPAADEPAEAVEAPAQAVAEPEPVQPQEDNVSIEALAAPARAAAPSPAIKPATTRASTPPPGVGARAYAIVERSCNALIWGKNEHERLAPASLTKIVTALVVEDKASLGESVQVGNGISGSAMAKRGSSVMGLEPGMNLTVRDLLYGLFLPSGNDAALALADHIGGGSQGFADLMNAKAGELGMVDSHFSNPHGLDSRTLYSSAYDMAIAGEAVLEDATLAQISAEPAYQVDKDGPVLRNGNKLLESYRGAFGVKIGYTTNAKQTIVAAAERDGRQIVVSLFGSENRYADTTALLDWAFSRAPSAC